MAKQEKELTVEEKLKALYELQQVDSKIDELRILAGELPQEVKDMSDEVEGLREYRSRYQSCRDPTLRLPRTYRERQCRYLTLQRATGQCPQ